MRIYLSVPICLLSFRQRNNLSLNLSHPNIRSPQGTRGPEDTSSHPPNKKEKGERREESKRKAFHGVIIDWLPFVVVVECGRVTEFCFGYRLPSTCGCRQLWAAHAFAFPICSARRPRVNGFHLT